MVFSILPSMMIPTLSRRLHIASPKHSLEAKKKQRVLLSYTWMQSKDDEYIWQK